MTVGSGIIATESNPILVLENNISIRPYRVSDIPLIAQNGNNRKIWLNLQDRFPNPYTEESARNWLALNANQDKFLETNEGEKVPTDYAICINDQAVGCIGLVRDEKQPHNVDLGYWIGENYWGRGIMKIAAGAFLQWCFDTFPWLVRVSADAYSWNEASMHILRKIGMEDEGRKRMAALKDGKYGDLLLFGIVRKNFMGRRAGRKWEDDL